MTLITHQIVKKCELPDVKVNLWNYENVNNDTDDDDYDEVIIIITMIMINEKHTESAQLHSASAVWKVWNKVAKCEITYPEHPQNVLDCSCNIQSVLRIFFHMIFRNVVKIHDTHRKK